MWERAFVGAGLPAIQAPRSYSQIEAMLSQASQLPHVDRHRTWSQRCFRRSMITANNRIEPRITYW